MINKLLVYLTHPHVDAWNFKPEHKEMLEAQAPGLQVTVCYHSADFLERLPNAEAVVVWYFKKEWRDKASHLKWIATPAAGTDWIEISASENLKISHGGFHGWMIAESVTGAIFYFCKAFALSSSMQRQTKWARKKISESIQSLYGANVTLLGFGKIGTAIGNALKPFGCTLTGVKRVANESPKYFSEGDKIVTVDHLSDVLKTTDHLVLVLPGGNDTQGILKSEHFKILPASSVVYNVGRGNVYKEEDLVNALSNGEIAGAYLDVFDQEPLPEESPLWGMKNVLIQPHLSAASTQYLELFVRELAGKISSGELG